jgi:hypothetical protein
MFGFLMEAMTVKQVVFETIPEIFPGILTDEVEMLGRDIQYPGYTGRLV